MPARESKYRSELIKRLKERFPECFFLYNDAGRIQGIPDLLMLWGTKWAAFETKRGLKADRQSNQGWYIDLLNEMSFAAFICPENEEEVLDELERAWCSH